MKDKGSHNRVLGMRRWLAYPVFVFVAGLCLVGIASFVNPNSDFEKMGGSIATLALIAAAVGLLQDSQRKKKRKDDSQ